MSTFRVELGYNKIPYYVSGENAIEAANKVLTDLKMTPAKMTIIDCDNRIVMTFRYFP